MRSSAKFAVLGVLGAVLLLSGCTTYVSVASDPEGAVITSADGSETYGRAPVTIEYDRDTLEANLGKVPGFVATWPSGAKAATEAPYVVRDFKYGAQIELQRPADAPGLEEDLRFALEQAQERAKRAEADRRRRQLYYQGGWMHGPFFGPGFWSFPELFLQSSAAMRRVLPGSPFFMSEHCRQFQISPEHRQRCPAKILPRQLTADLTVPRRPRSRTP